MRTLLAAATAVAIASGASALQQRSSVAPTAHTVTKAQVDRWMTELANWGRWGKEDERGTLNLLTPERRKTAMASARDGLLAIF